MEKAAEKKYRIQDQETQKFVEITHELYTEEFTVNFNDEHLEVLSRKEALNAVGPVVWKEHSAWFPPLSWIAMRLLVLYIENPCLFQFKTFMSKNGEDMSWVELAAR